ncbi:MAG: NAD(P)H-dependent oxidoreductase subunit E, partial [Planctomycetaceae bacterium]|nr:NAD(P)H-dependent oxidoreductase subunit E [Planctomycetaceae bacterium]
MKRLATIDNLISLRDGVRKQAAILEKDGQVKVRICMGGGCIASGSNNVHWAFVHALDEAKIDQRQCQLVKTGCLGPCSGGPALFIGDTFYELVKPEDVAELIQEHIVGGRVVERLLHKKADGSIAEKEQDIDFFKIQNKVVLRNCGNINPENIEEYIAVDGYQALGKVLAAKNSDAIIDEMLKSGLRGRGGGGFLTGKKWQFTKMAAGTEKYVVCNADEGDPGAFMDRSVLEGDPHSLIEGMAIAAVAIGATRGFVY